MVTDLRDSAKDSMLLAHPQRGGRANDQIQAQAQQGLRLPSLSLYTPRVGSRVDNRRAYK